MYKRFFFSKATAHMAFIGIVILCVGECVTGIIAGGMSRFNYFDMAARLFLSIFLFNGYKKHMYLDTGNWSYSWYRDNSGKTHTLIGLPWPFAHNWITFRK